jgi:hypothetical protein
MKNNWIPNPAQLNNRINHLILELNKGAIKKISGTQKKALCTGVIENKEIDRFVQEGGRRRRKSRRKSSSRRRTRKNNK